MILDMECLCNYKAGLKLTTRNLKWDIENKTSVSQSIIFHYKHHLWKTTWRATSHWFPKMFFFPISPKKKWEKLPPFSSCPLPTKIGWTGTPNHSGGTGSPFSRKTCRAWQRVHGIPMESQNMQCFGNLWKQWGKKHIKMILIDFGYPYSISRVYMKWKVCRSLESKSLWKTRHDLNLLNISKMEDGYQANRGYLSYLFNKALFTQIACIRFWRSKKQPFQLPQFLHPTPGISLKLQCSYTDWKRYQPWNWLPTSNWIVSSTPFKEGRDASKKYIGES